jgi:Domain of unknown function (DUF4845)
MGKLKAFIALFLIFGGIYLGWELIPPYFHKYELQDDVDEIARRNSYTQKTDDDIRALVIKQASSYDIPLKEDQIAITRSTDGMGISLHYTIHVDMPVHPMDLDFTVSSFNKRL